MRSRELLDRCEGNLPLIRTHGEKGVEHLGRTPVNDHRDYMRWVWKFSQHKKGSRVNDWFNSMNWWQKLGAHDARDFERVVGCFPEGTKNFQLKAAIPVDVLAGMLHFHPGLIQDDEEFDRLLTIPAAEGGLAEAKAKSYTPKVPSKAGRVRFKVSGVNL